VQQRSPVRAVTLSLPAAADLNAIVEYGDRLMRIGEQLTRAGLQLQTTRLSSTASTEPVTEDQLVERAALLSAGCARTGVGSASLGALWPRALTLLSPQGVAGVLCAHPELFLAVVVADGDTVCDDAVDFCGAVVQALAGADQEANFRFAAVGNIAGNGALFPGAFSSGGPVGVSAALESAGALAAAVRSTPPSSLADIAAVTAACLGEQLSTVDRALRPACERAGLQLHGYDPSPGCSPASSIGEFLELAGRIEFGRPGTLATCAAAARGIRSVGGPLVGYAGLMLPVLEDRVLARAWESGLIGTDSLLAYSAVCGTGLDTIALPASTPSAEILGVMHDLAALSARWSKPLSARLMLAAPGSDSTRTTFTAEQIVNIDYPRPAVTGHR
jgi:uncharacterized protein